MSPFFILKIKKVGNFMSDYVFQSGSCKKADLYNTIISIMKAAGWEDLATLPSTEYNVMHSKGVNGNQDLYIQLRPVSSAGAVATDVRTTNLSQISYRMAGIYTPGATGVAGTFTRNTLAYTDLYIAPVAAGSAVVLSDSTLNYKYYADAGKLIMEVEYPSTLNLGSLVFYIGQPDTVKLPESTTDGLVVASTANVTAGNLSICNTPDGVGDSALPYNMPTLAMLPLTNPNAAGVYFLSDVFYNSATEGVRGKLDGIKVMLNNKCLNGDNVTDVDGKKYYLAVCQAIGGNSFPSLAILFRI